MLKLKSDLIFILLLLSSYCSHHIFQTLSIFVAGYLIIRHSDYKFASTVTICCVTNVAHTQLQQTSTFVKSPIRRLSDLYQIFCHMDVSAHGALTKVYVRFHQD